VRANILSVQGRTGHRETKDRATIFLPQNMRKVEAGLDMQLLGCILFAGMDVVFKALADASRRELLDQLHRHNGQTLSELCGHLDMTRQAVAKHLALLEAANLVATVWRGREKFHYLNPVPLHEIYERWIHKYERGRLQALNDLKLGLEQNSENPKQGSSHGKTEIRVRDAH
jgi:DNA-binding transcriptional ArsR family regulator